jgi:hypothetical protein
MQQDRGMKELETEIRKGIDDAVDALRSARRHLDERPAAETLRLVQHNLGVLALSLDWHMEGEDYRAKELLSRLWWSPHKKEGGPLDMNPTGH